MSIVQLRLTWRQTQDGSASAEGRLPGANGRICLAGWVDVAGKPALYSLALGSVFVSEYEGFGLPVVEGMRC
jgi:glycosyltransferase involved in cell wall biosynthesis